ncbi:regulatory LuxR family protein [Labedella gwakjiensis]|uniref:Helix-turn-helix transcriptional regulator n=1 Tax=Labedella gwakjiensis TaxID=390269 RepID=A0A2P8GSD2_9MICO|nr:LuxR C-terminal-related transcriptional regulator [Labedella gwakjiensis]PSL36880.1 regulatory LuxR family protein [Labedella gwakjiensis]RUQ84377.1 helix-turn-helix transcriptional regulator [Labedella gwakjiensis]
MRTSALEPDASTVIEVAVADLARTSGIPVAFGGATVDGIVAVTSVVGARTNSLDGLTVSPRLGLGGQSLVDARPHATSDYGASRRITHDYDRHILGEGIAALLAVPVVVAGRTLGMIYGGSRFPGTVGDRFSASALAVASRISRDLAAAEARDTAARALDAASAEQAPPASWSSSLESARVAYAELRSITGTIGDPDLRERLASVERRLADLGGIPTASVDSPSPSDVSLSPRERDVLVQTSVGLTNSDVAARLGLKESTVKSYLASAMTKLDAPTRLRAVSEARRRGLIL